MATRRTKEEKIKLIADYETSGLSLSEWCATNGISKSTFAGWIRNTKSDVRAPKSKAKFVEVTLPIGLQEQLEPQAKILLKLQLNIKPLRLQSLQMLI